MNKLILIVLLPLVLSCSAENTFNSIINKDSDTHTSTKEFVFDSKIISANKLNNLNLPYNYEMQTQILTPQEFQNLLDQNTFSESLTNSLNEGKYNYFAVSSAALGCATGLKGITFNYDDTTLYIIYESKDIGPTVCDAVPAIIYVVIGVVVE
ncbi:MAG: hypothetical protein COA79_17575 [Planctomycetota bacterium]|nr:MAG: hypothetical protein COA79_17575 [Planctomycetota bacterium]